jgi:hypothetical protein
MLDFTGLLQPTAAKNTVFGGGGDEARWNARSTSSLATAAPYLRQ